MRRDGALVDGMLSMSRETCRVNWLLEKFSSLSSLGVVLQKQKRYVEISAGSEKFTILKIFRFKDDGK